VREAAVGRGTAVESLGYGESGITAANALNEVGYFQLLQRQASLHPFHSDRIRLMAMPVDRSIDAI
jgi:hypothetical protein